MTEPTVPQRAVLAALIADTEYHRTHPRVKSSAVTERHAQRLIEAAARDIRADERQRIGNAISWNTSCLSCATVLDSCYAETVRRERAEEKLAAVRSLAEQLGDRTGEPALPAPEVKVHLPLSDRRIVEPIRRRLLEILDGQTGGDQLEGYRPFHGPECPARTSRSADTCTCGGLGKPLWNPGDGPQRPVTP